MEEELRLSRIVSLWTFVRRAHGEPGEAAREALLERYGGAIRRYLLGALRDEDAADEVFQEFSLKLVGGAFQRADASHGRFRNFLKTALFHLIIDHQRHRQRRRGAERPLLAETPDRPPPSQCRGRAGACLDAELARGTPGQGLAGIGGGGAE